MTLTLEYYLTILEWHSKCSRTADSTCNIWELSGFRFLGCLITESGSSRMFPMRLKDPNANGVTVRERGTARLRNALRSAVSSAFRSFSRSFFRSALRFLRADMMSGKSVESDQSVCWLGLC